MLSLEDARRSLAANAEVITALTRLLPDAQYHWRPAPADWSILEVLGHLYDEEREDFRQRVRLTLESPDADWPPIHPGEWVLERAYNTWDPAQTLAQWQHERRASLQWLQDLTQSDWTRVHTHPRFGNASAGQMLGAWVAHDHLHIRQLNHLHWQWLAQNVDAFSLDYAGGW